MRGSKSGTSKTCREFWCDLDLSKIGTSNTHNGQPLCYLGLGAKKSYNSLYLMGVYDSSNGKYTTPFSEKLLVGAFKKAGKRLDMGKCCLHFKELDDLAITSVAKVIAMSTPKEYIAFYNRVKGRP